MRRLKALSVLATALMLVMSGSAAFAQNDDRGDEARGATITPVDRPVDRSTDRPMDSPVDRSVDRPSDRPSDRPVDRPSDRPVDRPQCDRDPAPDRPSDCRDHDGDVYRSFLRRCYNYIVERTDFRPSEHPRLFWILCHRLWWHHTHVR